MFIVQYYGTIWLLGVHIVLDIAIDRRQFDSDTISLQLLDVHDLLD